MYGGALPFAKSKKTKRKPLSEAEYLEEAFEQPAKKAKNAKKDKADEGTGSGLATIQEEVKDLGHTELISKRTRSGKEVVPSPPQPAQPSVPRRKRKPIVRKLKLTSEEDEEAAKLVISEVKKRKETNVVVEKALQLAKEIKIPAEVLAKESTVESAQHGLELTENLQQMVMTGNLVESEADGMEMEVAEVNQEEAGCSEAPCVSKAPEGNSNSHIAEIVEIGYCTSSKTRYSSSSLSSSSSTSSDPDDIPLSKIYYTLNKDLSQ